MRVGAAVLAMLALVATSMPTAAKTVLVPGPKPTTIEPGRQPFTFVHVPTVRTRFTRDEPFVEGEIAYGYPGRVVTPIRRGSDTIVEAGSPAYGVPMRFRARDNLAQGMDTRLGGKNWDTEAGAPQLVWCAITRKADPAKTGSICLLNEGLAGGGYDSLMTTAAYVFDHDPYGGGEIVAAQVELGGRVQVRYDIQNVGKIARIKGQIWIGDTMVNQWGYVFGDIGRGRQPAERRFAIGGGIVAISRDPATKDGYSLRVLTPFASDGSAVLTEQRNDGAAEGDQ